MKHHHHCLLLSLFDRPLIWNSNTNHYDICLKENNQNETKIKGLPGLFQNNYRFVIVDGKVRKIKFDELNLDSLVKSKTNNYEYEHSSFFELPDDFLNYR